MDYDLYETEYDENILDSVLRIVEDYTEKHGKMLTVRFDIRYPQYYDKNITNQDISRCIAKIVQKYKRQGYDPYYIWAREQEQSEHPHYHCALFLNGNKIQKYNHVFKTAETLWGNTIERDASGLIHHCTQDPDSPNGIMVRRCDSDYQDKLNAVVRQVGYLAKAAGKGQAKDGLRNFGMSRLPR